MTDEQKYAMENLRCQGFGYKKIASEIGVSESTVKSYFQRMKAKGEVPIMRKVPVRKKEPVQPVRQEILSSPALPDPPEKEDTPGVPVTTKPCLCCGVPVIQTPGRQEKKFCSPSCRIHWWNRNKYKAPRKSRKAFICECCGAEFTAYGVDNRKYCSHACYISARFHKPLEGGIA